MSFLSKIQISETLFLGIIPVIGYIAAYFYQFGRYSFFDIPSLFIQVNVELAIISTIITGFVILTFILFGYLISKLPSGAPVKNQTPVKQGTFRENLIAVVLAEMFFVFLFYIIELVLIYKILLFLAQLILFVIIVFVPPLLKFPEEKNYIKKFNKYSELLYLKKLEELSKKKPENTFSVSFTDLPQLKYILLVVFLAAWMGLSFVLGRLIIYNSEIFAVYKNSENLYIVAGIFSDNFIVVKVDKEHKVTTKEILLIPNESEIRINNEYVGRVNQEPENPKLLNRKN